MIRRRILKSTEVVEFRLLAAGIAALGGVALGTYAWAQSSPAQSTATTLTAAAQVEIDRIVTEIDRIQAESLATLSHGLPGPTQPDGQSWAQ
jgi:hypothetical protein